MLVIAIAGAIANAAEGASRYEAALDHYAAGNYRVAIIELRSALQERPDNVTARVLLGRALLASDQPRAAVAELEKGLGLGGDEHLILIPLGRAYMDLLEPEKVLISIPTRGHDPEIDGELLLLHGDAALLLNDLDSAERNYRDAVKLLPRDARPLVGRARVALAREHDERADVLIEQALELDPDSVDTWTLKGLLHRDRGEHDDAKLALGRALELDPDFTKALGARAALQLALGDELGAAADIDALRELNPVDLEGLYLKSLLLLRHGKHAEARELLHGSANTLRLIGKDYREKLPQAELMLGIVKFFDGHLNQAIDHMKAFLNRFPSHPGAKQYLAAAYFAVGDWNAVIATLGPKPGEEPSDDPATLSLLADALRASGDFRRAVKLYERALVLAPDQAGLEMRLAESRFETGDTYDAIAAMEKLAARLPDLLEARVLLTRMYVDVERLEDALALAHALAKDNPNDARIQNILGAAFMSNSEFRSAEGRFELAEALDPDDILPKLNRARLAVRKGQIHSAIDQYRRVLERYPDSAAAASELAEVLFTQGAVDEAERRLRDLVKRHPDQLSGHVGLLRVRVERGQLDGIDAEIFELIQRFREEPELLIAIGRLYSSMKDRENARLMLRRAAENADFDANDLYLVALEQFRIDDATGAHWSLTKALHGDPKHIGALGSRVVVLIAMGKWEQAKEALAELKATYPERPETFLAEGDLQIARGNLPAATAAFVLAHERAPSRATMRRLFSAQIASGDPAAAVRTVRRWIVIHPDDLESRHLLAEHLIAAGEFRSAQLVYEGIAKKDPDNAVVANNLAVLYQKQGDPRALEFAERAVETAPTHPSFLDTYGWILAETGQPERGLEILRDAQTRESTNQEIRYHIALALLRLGRKDGARRELEVAVQSDKTFPSKQEAQTLLEKLD